MSEDSEACREQDVRRPSLSGLTLHFHSPEREIPLKSCVLNTCWPPPVRPCQKKYRRRIVEKSSQGISEQLWISSLHSVALLGNVNLFQLWTRTPARKRWVRRGFARPGFPETSACSWLISSTRPLKKTTKCLGSSSSKCLGSSFMAGGSFYFIFKDGFNFLNT